MKLKDLIPKLQALNPEAEVWADGWGGMESEGPGPVEHIYAGKPYKSMPGVQIDYDKDSATPSDTLIVLSE